MSGPKQNFERMERMINAWQTLAPTKTFGGITLEQFKLAAAPMLEARQAIAEHKARLKQEMAARDDADDIFNEKAKLVVAGVLGDPTEGPDSALYGAFGYTRESEQKSGLTRKRDDDDEPDEPAGQ